MNTTNIFNLISNEIDANDDSIDNIIYHGLILLQIIFKWYSHVSTDMVNDYLHRGVWLL